MCVLRHVLRHKLSLWEQCVLCDLIKPLILLAHSQPQHTHHQLCLWLLPCSGREAESVAGAGLSSSLAAGRDLLHLIIIV